MCLNCWVTFDGLGIVWTDWVVGWVSFCVVMGNEGLDVHRGFDLAGLRCGAGTWDEQCQGFFFFRKPFMINSYN